ncbi:MAG: DUF1929 domain-containing protein [Planctomycetota bacterium]
MFEAVHMSLIPKGDNRGKVLVWNLRPVLCKSPTYDPTLGTNSNLWWACQAYAIVDLSPNATVRYQNFLLPIERVDPDNTTPGHGYASDLFCAGHCWTQFGDLVVVGGTKFNVASGYTGPVMTYVFNPAANVGPFPLPSGTQPLYPPPGTAGSIPKGLWVAGPDMFAARWYAMATLTKKIARSPVGTSLQPRPRVIIAGGSSQIPGTWSNSPWNSYEAFVVDSGCILGNSGLIVDSTPGTLPRTLWDGPGTPPPNGGGAPPFNEDWLQEYPRLHSFSNGTLFQSGYVPRGALLDHEPLTPFWTKMAAQTGRGAPYSSNWANPRHDGSSVVINIPGLYDCVMRLGGSSTVPYAAPTGTDTVEWSFGGGPWLALPKMIATDGFVDGARTHLNAVTLPTGVVLVLGGENNFGQAVVSPLIFADGSWHKDVPNPTFSPRRYHSAVLLLDDGNVAIGGGDPRSCDYEVYKPYYTLLPASHKPVNLTFPSPPVFDPVLDAWELNYGAQYDIECDPFGDPDVKVQKAVLIPPGSTTHSSDMHHRYVELTTVATSHNQVRFDMPGLSEEGVAPSGLYRLWLVTNTGAVSNALWVVVR